MGDKYKLLTSLKEATFLLAIYLYFTGFIYIYYYYDSFGIGLNTSDTPIYSYFIYSYNVASNLTNIQWNDEVGGRLVRIGYVLVAVVLAVLVFKQLRNPWFKRALTLGSLAGLFPLLGFLANATAKAEVKRLRLELVGQTINFRFKSDSSIRPPIKVLNNSVSGEPRSDPNPNDQHPPNKPATADADNPRQCNWPPKKGEDPAECLNLKYMLDANDRTSPERIGPFVLPKLYLITETSTSFYVLYQPHTADLAPRGYVFEIPKAEVLMSTVEIY